MMTADISPEVRALLAEIVAENRKHTQEGYERVCRAYGSSYANGWKSGRERLADMIEEEVQG